MALIEILLDLIEILLDLIEILLDRKELKFMDAKDRVILQKSQTEVMEILKRYLELVRPVLGERLKSVILYGSYARKDFVVGSDIDIMLMVDNEDLREYNDRLLKIEVDINLSNDVLIVPIAVSEEKLMKYKDAVPFYRNVINEGKVLYEQ